MSAALVELTQPVPTGLGADPYHLVDALLAENGIFEPGLSAGTLSAGIRGSHPDHRLLTCDRP